MTSSTSTKQNPSSQSQPKTQSQSVVIPTQKPAVTVAAVQPQANVPKTSTAHQSAPSMQSRPSVTEETKTSLPQLPPRVQSQASVPSRGPPPAIPPRNNLGTRSSSIQVTSAGPINRPALTRQTSANMIPPQFTPQPPPKFVIPQRQSSRTSMGRSGSISGPSDSGSPSSTSPQSQRRQHWKQQRNSLPFSSGEQSPIHWVLPHRNAHKLSIQTTIAICTNTNQATKQLC